MRGDMKKKKKGEKERNERKKKRFLLMNKGNFIFCLSFSMTLPTLCSVMHHSFLLQFATVHSQKSDRESRAASKRGREAKRILFRCFSHHNHH
jgi:ribosomal protein S8E